MLYLALFINDVATLADSLNTPWPSASSVKGRSHMTIGMTTGLQTGRHTDRRYRSHK